MQNKNVAVKNNCHSRGMLSGIYNDCRCKNAVMLNSFQHLHPTQTCDKEGEILSQVQDDNNIKEETLNKGFFRDPFRSGFTLIELLIVVLIIGILAAVAVPQYRIAVAKSHYATLKNLVESIVQAEEIYYLSNGEYTNTPSQLDIILPTPNSTSSEFNQTIVNYNWGFCKFNFVRVFCTNSEQENIAYGHWFAHTEDGVAGKRRCQVKETNDITDWRNAICKQETQDSNPVIESGNNQIVYRYQ